MFGIRVFGEGLYKKDSRLHNHLKLISHFNIKLYITAVHTDHRETAMTNKAASENDTSPA